ncbi:hypothetical protein ACFE04_010405 [Oxalis oulophora]
MKQLVDHDQYPIHDGAGNRHFFIARPFEVGSDQNVTIDCILNQLRETGLNYLRVPGTVGEEFNISPSMCKHNLILIMTKIRVEIDNYPCREDLLEVETWLRPHEKIGLQYDWTIRNLMTQKLNVRARRHVPKESDIDMNKHVNNVKYANWMLEAIPDQIAKDYQLSTITLDYKRECGMSETIQSLCQPDKDNEIHYGIPSLGFTHLLQVQGIETKKEIIRGRTTWKTRNT